MSSLQLEDTEVRVHTPFSVGNDVSEAHENSLSSDISRNDPTTPPRRIGAISAPPASGQALGTAALQHDTRRDYSIHERSQQFEHDLHQLVATSSYRDFDMSSFGRFLQDFQAHCMEQSAQQQNVIDSLKEENKALKSNPHDVDGEITPEGNTHANLLGKIASLEQKILEIEKSAGDQLEHKDNFIEQLRCELGQSQISYEEEIAALPASAL